jgi:hypothetical protein
MRLKTASKREMHMASLHVETHGNAIYKETHAMRLYNNGVNGDV